MEAFEIWERSCALFPTLRAWKSTKGGDGSSLPESWQASPEFLLLLPEKAFGREDLRRTGPGPRRKIPGSGQIGGTFWGKRQGRLAGLEVDPRTVAALRAPGVAWCLRARRGGLGSVVRRRRGLRRSSSSEVPRRSRGSPDFGRGPGGLELEHPDFTRRLWTLRRCGQVRRPTRDAVGAMFRLGEGGTRGPLPSPSCPRTSPAC